MNNKKSLPTSVTFAILTVITAFVWIGFEIYRALTTDAPPSVPPEVTASLDPTLNTSALADITERIHLEEDKIGETLLPALIHEESLVPNESPAEEPDQAEESTEEAEPDDKPDEEEDATQ